MTIAPLPVYDMTLNLCIGWQAHSLSTIGSNGSNRILPRRQMLADETETDACSGKILKRRHANLAMEQFGAEGCQLCPACRVRDGRRAGALLDRPGYPALSYAQILQSCALCDTHGFLVLAKRTNEQQGVAGNEQISKKTLIDFSLALARPHRHAETIHVHTLSGLSKEEQMIMKMPVRSGEYALNVRYAGVGIGADTQQWTLYVDDIQERRKRHRILLQSLRDWAVSPDGAMTATMLPHLTSMVGAIVVKTEAGRAPCLSALSETFLPDIQAMADSTCHVFPFETIPQFYAHMNHLIEQSAPAMHSFWQREETQGQ